MIPRIQGGATISVWVGVLRYPLYSVPPSDCSREETTVTVAPSSANTGIVATPAVCTVLFSRYTWVSLP